MPFGRITRRLVDSSTRRSGRDRVLTVKAKKQVSKIAKRTIARQSELKRYDAGVAYANTPYGNAPGIIDCFAPVQGNTDTNRNGDRTMLCGRAEFRILADNLVNATGSPYELTILIFQWHPNTVPTINSVLNNGPTSAFPESSSFTNMDNRQEYTILFRKNYTMVSEFDSSRLSRHIVISMKKAQKFVQFVNGGTVGTNKIYFMYFVDNPASSSHKMELASRVFFRDY